MSLPEEPLIARAPIRVMHYFAFPGGGIGRYVHELLTRMTETPGLEVELACIPSYHYRREARYPLWPNLREITHPTAWRRRLRFAANLVFNPLRAIRRAKETGAQILHLSTIPHVTFALWSRSLLRARIKLVATAHDIRRSHALIWHRYELEQLRRLYRRCEVLFVHSEYQKRDLIDFACVSAEKVVVVPHGPSHHGPPQADRETLRRRYGVPLDKQVALFFGDIRPDKNLDLLLRAMAPFKDRLFLVVAGQEKSRDKTGFAKYARLIEELQLIDNVKWRCEYIPNEEVPNYFELCDWVAMPYGSRFTSQSAVLNVAMAHQRPVLITATPTIVETLDNHRVGAMAVPNDLSSLIKAISEMLADSHDRFRASIEAYLAVYSWEENVRKTLCAYRGCLR